MASLFEQSSPVDLQTKHLLKIVERRIRLGRLFTTVLILLWLLVIVTLIAVLRSSDMERQDTANRRFRDSYTVCFAALFISLCTCVAILGVRIRQKRNSLQSRYGLVDFSTRKETVLLIVILTVFSLSYLLRVLNDAWPDKGNKDTFRSYMILQFSGIPFDIVPISLILVLHRKNLGAAAKGKTEPMPVSSSASDETASNLFYDYDYSNRVPSSSNDSVSQVSSAQFKTETISSHELPVGYQENQLLDQI